MTSMMTQEIRRQLASERAKVRHLILHEMGKRGFTTKRLAEELGCSRPNISKVLNGGGNSEMVLDGLRRIGVPEKYLYDPRQVAERMTIDELHEFIRERLESVPEAEVPSRSSLGRYSKQLNEVAQYLRESREMAKALAQELGPDSVEGEQGRHLVEILRSFVSNAMKQRIGDPNAKFDANEISKIARSLRDLSQAMHLEQDYAKRIRDDERQKMRQELTDIANAGGFKDLSDEELNAKIIELTTQPGA